MTPPESARVQRSSSRSSDWKFRFGIPPKAKVARAVAPSKAPSLADNFADPSLNESTRPHTFVLRRAKIFLETRPRRTMLCSQLCSQPWLGRCSPSDPSSTFGCSPACVANRGHALYTVGMRCMPAVVARLPGKCSPLNLSPLPMAANRVAGKGERRSVCLLASIGVSALGWRSISGLPLGGRRRLGAQVRPAPLLGVGALPGT